jgi:hypothetical protein
MVEERGPVKRKLIAWLTARVDACLQSEAWQRYKAEQERAEAYHDRANTFEIQIAGLRQALHNEGKRAEHYKAKADELEARIANALT